MHDRAIENLIKKETKRQNETINLIASENYVSRNVCEALGSVFTNKYAEGYPGKRYYAGCEIVDELESLAQERALKLYKLSARAWSVNVQPYSGSPANLAVYLAFLKPGDKIMGMSLSHGGHLTHGAKVSASGKLWRAVHYGVDKKTETIDYNALRTLVKKEKPRILIAGWSAYSKILDFKKFRHIADTVGAIFMVDMSHFSGLVAGKAHPSPFLYADVVTTTTHKTLRGPRGAMIFSRAQFSKAIDRTVFPGVQGGPHVNQIAALAVALKEASEPSFRKYAAQVVKNARALARELRNSGWRVIARSTDTHLFSIDTFARGVSGGQAETILERVGIVVNRESIPFDTRSPNDPSGIRIGTPAVTTRGMKEKEMKKIGELISGILLKQLSPSTVLKEVRKLTKKFPIPSK